MRRRRIAHPLGLFLEERHPKAPLVRILETLKDGVNPPPPLPAGFFD